MNFRPEMRKVTHVLPQREVGKASGPGVPPKAHAVRPGYATHAFTVPPPSHPSYGHSYASQASSSARMPMAGVKHDRSRRVEPKAPVAEPAPSPRQGSKEVPRRKGDRQVTKKWEAVRERALTLLAPAASPRAGDVPKRSWRKKERQNGTAEVVRDRALTLLASSNSDKIKERTKTFIEKHQVDISLEPDELPDKQEDQTDQPEMPAETPAETAKQAPEDDIFHSEASPEQSAEHKESKKSTSPGKSNASASPFAPPQTPFADEETQLAQLSAGIFWILSCLFQCFCTSLSFSLRLCVCCAKNGPLQEPKRRFNGETVEAPVETARPSFGFLSTADTEKRSFVSAAAAEDTGKAASVRRAPRKGVRSGKAKNSELSNELEKLEEFFRQEAVFMAKAGSGSN